MYNVQYNNSRLENTPEATSYQDGICSRPSIHFIYPTCYPSLLYIFFPASFYPIALSSQEPETKEVKGSSHCCAEIEKASLQKRLLISRLNSVGDALNIR